MPLITIVGLGPGSPDLLTREAQETLLAADEIYLRTRRHPVVLLLPRSIATVAFDDLYGQEPVERASRDVAGQIVALGQRPQGVVYATPGNPMIGDQSVRAILSLATQRSVPVRIVAGISQIDAVCQSLRIDLLTLGAQVLDAADFAGRARAAAGALPDAFTVVGRVVDPTTPLLLCQIHSRAVLAASHRALLDLYGAEHLVSAVFLGDGLGPESVETIPLGALDRLDLGGRSACLYVGPVARLADLAGFDTLRYIVARLRAPNGCPWDREQTHQSLKKHLIEETYEAVAALDDADWEKFSEELGDVLLQVVMHGQLGQEEGRFRLEDVLRAVNEKLIRRHPHVFGDVKAETSADVLRNWEKIKRAENTAARRSFASIPQAMPALMRAAAVQSRAARHGWTPPEAMPDLTRLERTDLDQMALSRELGEALFELVALARRHEVDPEEALRLATNQFADQLEAALARRAESAPDAGTPPAGPGSLA